MYTKPMYSLCTQNTPIHITVCISIAVEHFRQLQAALNSL